MNERLNLNDFLRPEVKKLAVDLELYLQKIDVELRFESWKSFPSRYLSKLMSEIYDEMDYSLRNKDKTLGSDILDIVIIALLLRKEENL